MFVKKRELHYWEGVATMIGTIIGAGVLGLPYAIATVGVPLGLLLLTVLGAAVGVINLMVAEVALRTEETHQLPGLVGHYLGKHAKYFQTAVMIFSGYGALLAYTIGQGTVLGAVFGGSSFIYSLAFFSLAAAVLYWGLKVVKVFEFWLVLTLLAVIGVIFLISFGQLEPAHYVGGDWRNWLMPYGVILFAFSGASSVIQLRRILIRQKGEIKSAVMTASFIPWVIYVLFALLVIGVCGTEISTVATVALGERLGPLAMLFTNLFAFFAMGTSFLTGGLSLREMYEYDFKINKVISWLLVCVPPLVVFLLGAREFVEVLKTVGAIAFGFSGCLIVLTYWRARRQGLRRPEFALPDWKALRILLLVMFVLGIVYSLKGWLN